MAVANTSRTPSTFRYRTDPGTVLWVDLCFGEADDRFPWEIRLLLRHLGAVAMNALGNPEQPSCTSRGSFRNCVYLGASGQELQPPTLPTAQPTLGTLKY